MSTRFHSQNAPKVRSLAGCLILLLLLAGCGDKGTEESVQETDDSSPESGGTVVIALNEDPDVLNSLIRRSAIAGMVLDKVQDTLAEMGEDLAWHPLIADGWVIAEDRLSITYHLRPWTWQDGVPLTALDVVSSFDLLRDPAVGSPRRGLFKDVDRAAALDSSTVRYSFHKPLPDPVARTFHAILPRHVTEKLDPAQVMSWDINRAPLASGPFSLESWEHGRSLSLVPNPRFPLKHPFVDRVIFRIIPDAAGRVVSLETGEVDLVDNLGPVDARRLQEKGNVKIASLGGRQYYYLNWNIRLPIFADPATRRALSLAIDRQRMIDTLLLGYAQAAAGPVPPVMWNFNRELVADPHDPARARAMLAEAGWADLDGDGVLERDGKKLSFEILTKLGDPVRENGSTIIRENLRDVGAEAQVRVLELATGLELLEKGQFEAYFGSFNANLYGDPSGVVHSQATSEFNKGGYANATVDSLLEVVLAMTDREQALPHWKRLQAVLQEDPPSAYLFFPQRLVGYNPRLRDVRPHLLSPFNNLSEWWIATSDRKYRSGN